MTKQILTEYINLSYNKDDIKEAIERGNGTVLVKAILQRANHKNQNGRIYPREVLETEVEKYISEYVRERRALGELDHTSSDTINLKNVSHNIKDIIWEGDDVVGVIEILDTPSGRIAKELLKAGINVGISSRGLGSVTKVDNDTVKVDPGYTLLGWDLVSTPSTQGAFLHEGKSETNLKDQVLNELIYDFFSQVGNN